MKGELVRGKRSNHLVVRLPLVASTFMMCSDCGMETSHGVFNFLGKRVTFCGLCYEVRSQ